MLGEDGTSVSAVHSQDSALHPTQLLSMQETQKLCNFGTDWMKLLQDSKQKVSDKASE